MAFIRSKKVHGHEYYQVVHNYRDHGKHRQKVLVHLGKHSSIELAITAERENFQYYRERVSKLRKEAEGLRAKLLDHLYAVDFKNGEIPSIEKARQEINNLRKEREAYFYSGTESMDIVDIDLKKDIYWDCIRYRTALSDAAWDDRIAEACQKRLENYLRVQREYF